MRRDIRDIYQLAKARKLIDSINENTLPIWAGGIIDAYEQLQNDGFTKERARAIAVDSLSEYFFGEGSHRGAKLGTKKS